MRTVGIGQYAMVLAAVSLPVALAVAPVAAQVSPLAMLDRLERGEWLVRSRDGGELRRLCLRNGHDLIQLRHKQPGCSRYIVEDSAGLVTVQYSCAGNGYGRTSIRRESATLVQIESQGIADGRPFQFTAEARRVGTCR